MKTAPILADQVTKARDALDDLAAMADMAILDHDALGLAANARNRTYIEIALRIAIAAVKAVEDLEESR